MFASQATRGLLSGSTTLPQVLSRLQIYPTCKLLELRLGKNPTSKLVY